MTNVRDDLAARRAETERRLAALVGDYDAIVAGSHEANTDDEHDPEGATIAFERSQVGALADQARYQLNEIDAALTRLGAGTYGICTVCDQPIARMRLTARPTAATCVDCAQ